LPIDKITSKSSGETFSNGGGRAGFCKGDNDN
jgi:hypothetical protein